MPTKNTGNRGFQKRPGGSPQSDTPFYSPKLPKADLKALKEELDKDPSFILDFLANFPPHWRMWTKQAGEDGTCTVYVAVHPDNESDPTGIVCQRASNHYRCLAAIAYIFKSLTIESMFPDEDSTFHW